MTDAYRIRQSAAELRQALGDFERAAQERLAEIEANANQPDLASDLLSGALRNRQALSAALAEMDDDELVELLRAVEAEANRRGGEVGGSGEALRGGNS